LGKPIDPSVYRLRIFSERGYMRQRCRYCGAYFWSIAKREHCNDAPCTLYRFAEIPSRRRLSFREALNTFLRFFEKHGHEILEPRPVVARWREDLYLTIASIVVFQPHVTSGVVPPPANPLVIAQPCIRLEDIDHVGLTFGRHLTNFTMGGHHAFNYPDKKVYWANETIELAREFFVEELGIPEEELSFKESWWEGGGNAGPSFEVAVGGLELATLVFMMYRVRDGSYEEMPIKIVDTGYGIERIAWFTQKTPTAFHAVYGELVDEFHRKLGAPKPPDELLRRALPYVARVDPSDPESVTRFYTDVARDMGVSKSVVEEELGIAFNVYAVLDHTKTIALMLSDGVVPSNSGEGYLARLVIRRALRRIHLLGADVPLKELVLLQVRYWSRDHPRMAKARDYVEEILGLEEERYRSTLRRISSIANRFLKKPPALEQLIELYDSHGIPPELLREELRRRGVEITVPPNFYELVASRHMEPSRMRSFERSKLPREVEEWARSFPETERLFHKDPYLRSFTARVLGVRGRYLVLDRTAFYPEGGGQLGDTGFIEVSGRRFRVADTQKVGSVVVHVLTEEVRDVKRGAVAKGYIDWERRYRLMRHHTATHILLGALRRVLGEHVWQAGAEKTAEKARLDVTHYELPDPSTVRKIEQLVNTVVTEALPVRTMYMHRNDAEAKYGFTLFQGGVPMEPVIRVVEIPGWDAEACFGTHVKNTSEVGSFKIINVEKIADGVVRFEYVAGPAVSEYAQRLEDELDAVAKAVGGSRAEVMHRVRSVVEELKSAKELLRQYRSYWVERELETILRSSRRVGSIQFAIYTPRNADNEAIKRLIQEAISRTPQLALVALMPMHRERTLIEISLGREAAKTVDARQLLRALAEASGKKVRGGGKRDHVTGYAELPLDKIASAAEEAIEKLLKQN